MGIKFGGQKAFTDELRQEAGAEKPKKILWERVVEEALRLLDENPDLGPRLKAKAQSLINNPNFRKRIKSGWDNDTLRGIVDEDPEEQDHLWARGLAQTIKSELSAPDNK